MAVRRRKLRGIIPALVAACGRVLRWLLVHPQWLLALGLVAGGGWGLCRFVSRSEAFRVREVRVPPKSLLKVPAASLLGRNIWAVDLEALARDVKAQQPHLKRVRVIRLLPQTIQIETLERTPVAQVLLRGWHPVDRDGYILPASAAVPANQLVIVKGVENPKAPLAPGKLNSSERLQRALQLIEQLRASPWLAGHRLTVVDVADPQQVNFVIDQDVEIRCGSQAQLTQDLKRLRTVLQQLAKHGLGVRYIDLRFQDPVIGPRS